MGDRVGQVRSATRVPGCEGRRRTPRGPRRRTRRCRWRRARTGRRDGARVGAGADEQDAGRGPVAGEHVEADGHDRAPGGGQLGQVGDLAGGPQRLLDGLGEEPAGGAVVVGGLERAAQLPRDLALPHDHRVQAGADVEQVVERVGVTEDAQRHLVRTGGDRVDGVPHATSHSFGGRVGVHVHLDAVAGGQHDGAADGCVRDEAGPCTAGVTSTAEPVLGVVNRDQMQRHDLPLNHRSPPRAEPVGGRPDASQLSPAAARATSPRRRGDRSGHGGGRRRLPARGPPAGA